jgi:hypothetical protein
MVVKWKRHRENNKPAIVTKKNKEWWVNGKRHREDGPALKNDWYINDILRDKEWVKKYLKIKEKHSIAGVMVSNYWKIREIILRWRYNPNLQCVKNKLKREFESYKI